MNDASLPRGAVFRQIKVDTWGYKQLAEGIGDPSGCVAVGIEGTTSYGAGLCSHLMESAYAAFKALRPKGERGESERASPMALTPSTPPAQWLPERA